MGRVHWHCRATPQKSAEETGMAASAKGSEVITRGQLGKRLQNTESRPSTALLFTALAAVGQRGSGLKRAGCKPMPGPPCSQLKHLQGLLVAQESETQPGFNVSENHQNQHVKTILAAQSSQTHEKLLHQIPRVRVLARLSTWNHSWFIRLMSPGVSQGIWSTPIIMREQ